MIRMLSTPRIGTALSLALLAVVVAIAIAADLLADDPQRGEEAQRIAVIAIFTGCYAGLAIGRIPGLAIDRAGIALAGAGLMVVSGGLSLDEAYRAVDLDTLTLLLGIMIVVANLRLSGFFAIANGWMIRHARTPYALLGGVIAMAGLFSAFLVNDAVCLVLAPLVLTLAQSMKRNPVPYLLAVAMASNIGSVATITGNPQNIMIGSLSQIAYVRFAETLSPVALVGLVVAFVLIALLYRSEFAPGIRLAVPTPDIRVNRPLVFRSLGAVAAMIALFFAGTAPAKAAIIIGGLLLLTRRLKSQRIYAEIDWPLLLMFAGLFIIVAGAEHTLLSPGVIAAVGQLDLNRIPVLCLVTAVLSNLVSNVPAVLVIKPFVVGLVNPERAWLAVAMAATLAGNFTLLGSIANLIVAQKAANAGVTIGFAEYFRVGAPLTLATLVIGMLWL